MKNEENKICPLLRDECLEEKCALYMELTLKKQCAIKHIAECTDNVDGNILAIVDNRD